MPEPGNTINPIGRTSRIRSLRLNGAALACRFQSGLKTTCVTLRLSAQQAAMRSAPLGRSAAEDGGRRLFCFAMQSREIGGLANLTRGVKSRRRKIAAARRCGPRPLAVRSPSGRPGGAVLPGRQDHREQMRSTGPRTSSESFGPGPVHRVQEPGHIFRGKLEAQGRAKMIDAKVAEVFIEIP